MADGQPRCCRPAGSARGPAAPGRLARRATHLGARDIDRHAGRLRGGHQRPGRRPARALGRLSGPRRVQRHHHQGRRVVPAGRFAAAGCRSLRPDHPLRCPRARDGCGPQRDRPARAHPRVRRHLPGVQRLHARPGPPGRPDEPAVAVHLDARLGRRRRGRSDPPAHRAPVGAPGDPRALRGPPGGRQRDGGGLGGCPGEPRSRRADPHPPERAHPRPLGGRAGLGCQPRCLRDRRGRRR